MRILGSRSPLEKSAEEVFLLTDTLTSETHCFTHVSFLFAEVCGEPQPHGLLQRAAPAGVRRGAVPAQTQVIGPAPAGTPRLGRPRRSVQGAPPGRPGLWLFGL